MKFGQRIPQRSLKDPSRIPQESNGTINIGLWRRGRERGQNTFSVSLKREEEEEEKEEEEGEDVVDVTNSALRMSLSPPEVDCNFGWPKRLRLTRKEKETEGKKKEKAFRLKSTILQLFYYYT